MIPRLTESRGIAVVFLFAGRAGDYLADVPGVYGAAGGILPFLLVAVGDLCCVAAAVQTHDVEAPAVFLFQQSGALAADAVAQIDLHTNIHSMFLLKVPNGKAKPRNLSISRFLLVRVTGLEPAAS